MRCNIFLRIILSVILSMSSLTMVNADATPTHYSDPNKPIMVEKKRPQFTIALAANPSTGYSWFLANYDTQLITLIKHAYQMPLKAMPGAGGTEIWTFKVNDAGFMAPQITRIKLIYARPWNLQDNARETEFSVVTR